jgi:hypothetical protein
MSSPIPIHGLGFEVVSPKTVSGIERFEKLSRRYVVKAAAEEMAALMRSNGHPKAYVREVMGTEGIRGGKRFMAKSGAL